MLNSTQTTIVVAHSPIRMFLQLRGALWWHLGGPVLLMGAPFEAVPKRIAYGTGTDKSTRIGRMFCLPPDARRRARRSARQRARTPPQLLHL